MYMPFFVKTHTHKHKTHTHFILITTLQKTKSWPPNVWNIPLSQVRVSGIPGLRSCQGSSRAIRCRHSIFSTWISLGDLSYKERKTSVDPYKHRLELHRSTYTWIFFLMENTTLLYNLWWVESVDSESQVRKADCIITGGFSTGKVSVSIPHVLQGSARL